MEKILKFTNLSLCVTAFTAMAHANRIDYAPEHSAPFTEYQANSLAGSSVNTGDFSFSQAAGPRGQIHDGDTAPKSRKFPKKSFSHVFDWSPSVISRVAINDAGTAKQVPDTASTLALFGLSALGLVAMRRKFLN